MSSLGPSPFLACARGRERAPSDMSELAMCILLCSCIFMVSSGVSEALASSTLSELVVTFPRISHSSLYVLSLRSIALPDCGFRLKGKYSRICTLPVSRKLLSYIADIPCSGCYPTEEDTETNYSRNDLYNNANDRRSRRLALMRMLRQNTRASIDRSWLFSLSSRHISRTQSFQEKRQINIKDLATLKRFVAVIGRPVPCTARLASDRRTDGRTDKQTDRPSTVTIAAHARQGLMMRHPSIPFISYKR